MIRSPRRHAAKLRTTGASTKIATRVATPARLRAMAARERHVGRIVGRAYGYRPKRSAGKAVSAVHRLLRCGYTDVVDVPAELPGS